MSHYPHWLTGGTGPSMHATACNCAIGVDHDETGTAVTVDGPRCLAEQMDQGIARAVDGERDRIANAIAARLALVSGTHLVTDLVAIVNDRAPAKPAEVADPDKDLALALVRTLHTATTVAAAMGELVQHLTAALGAVQARRS